MNLVLYIVILVVIAFAVWFIHSGRRATKQKNEYESSGNKFLAEAFVNYSFTPKVTVEWVYGSPVFTLDFETNAQKEAALENGKVEDFTSFVQEMCGDLRHMGSRFDAKNAVCAISDEERAAWKKQAEAYKNQK